MREENKNPLMFALAGGGLMFVILYGFCVAHQIQNVYKGGQIQFPDLAVQFLVVGVIGSMIGMTIFHTIKSLLK